MKIDFSRAVSVGQSDNRFASINQVVIGTPPLYTGGVQGCTVIAGSDGLKDWLMHIDSETVVSNEPYDFIEKMQPTIIIALTLRKYVSFLEDNDPIGIIQADNYTGLLKQVSWNGTNLEILNQFPDVLINITPQEIAALMDCPNR